MPLTAAPVRIGMVVGEASGDQLGAPLIPALRRYFPDAIFEGIGGPRMQAEGFNSLYAMERLSVMGFVEPLKRLPELLRIRRGLYRHFVESGTTLVIGIDAPDFNLGLEEKLRREGILTAHYVSPSVWAWRQGRIKKIARAVDLMLTLFPFEADFYRQHRVAVAFVGHPLADQFPMQPSPATARQRLGLSEDGPLLAIMPGSRGSEVAMLAPLFLDVAEWCQRRIPDLRFVLPAANAGRRRQLEEMLEDRDLPLTLLDGNSHSAMEAADAVLLASGTTALEAMLLKKPMVVSYRLGKMTYRLVSRLVKTEFVSLPNLLAGKRLVPELLQDQATVEGIGQELLSIFSNPEASARLVETFADLHRQLKADASAVAASHLSKLVAGKTGLSPGDH